MKRAMTSRRAFLRAGVTGLAAVALHGAARGAEETPGKRIRLGVIGVGGRGTYLLGLLLARQDVDITAICDIDRANLDNAIAMVEKARGKAPAGYSKDEHDYRSMLERDDFEAVLIATPTSWHAPMAIDAMRAGKHAASEVPACHNLDECWALVKTKEQTGRHYIMLENYLFAEENLAVLNMVAQGVFGEPYYAECGYIHELKGLKVKPDGSLTWRGELARSMYGNSYPTHSAGPVCKWLGINEGDRLQRLTCYSTGPNRSMPLYYAKRFGKEKAEKLTWRSADMTTCLIRTAKNRVIKVDYDTVSNRPHAFYYLLQGTQGIFDSRFGISLLPEDAQLDKDLDFHWEKAARSIDRYSHPLWQRYKEEAFAAGHGGADFFSLREMVNMIRDDREPWMDVYDAVTWSAIHPCSRKSLDRGNKAVEIPDFTKGRWEKPGWRTTGLPV